MSRLITRVLGLYLNLQIIITWYLMLHNAASDTKILKILVLMMTAVALSLNFTTLYGTVLLSLPIIKKLLNMLQYVNSPETIVIKTGLILFMYLVINQSLINII